MERYLVGGRHKPSAAIDVQLAPQRCRRHLEVLAIFCWDWVRGGQGYRSGIAVNAIDLEFVV